MVWQDLIVTRVEFEKGEMRHRWASEIDWGLPGNVATAKKDLKFKVPIHCDTCLQGRPPGVFSGFSVFLSASSPHIVWNHLALGRSTFTPKQTIKQPTERDGERARCVLECTRTICVTNYYILALTQTSCERVTLSGTAITNKTLNIFYV